MRDNTELQQQIVSLVLENVNLEVPSVHQDLIETGLLDSLKIVELLTELERRFRLKISVNDLDIDSFRSIERITDLVVNHSDCGGMPNAVTSEASSRATQDHVAE
jgi:acyl carrier protein